MVNAPAAVGVPEIVPSAARTIPEGIAPDVIVKVYGATPPDTNEASLVFG
jgi:hypothetical protein